MIRFCRGAGFTLVELLVALALGMLIVSMLFQLFLVSQRTMKIQIELSTLIYRTRRVTDMLRADIHRAHGKVSVIDGRELMVGSHIYLVEKSRLVLIDDNHRKIHLVEQVSEMTIIKSNDIVDISVHVVAGSLGKTIHVLASLK